MQEKDWNAEWRRLSVRPEGPHDAAFWDRRARDYGGGDESSPYVTGFLRYLAIRPGESVLDVGCGTGTLALPLARAGHQVTGLDFSTGMLERLRRRASEEGLEGITTIQASWDDDWAAAGVGCADVVIASRSLDVPDLRAALDKLCAYARRRVAVALPEDGVLYRQLLAHAAVGRPLVPRGDRRTAVGVLRQMGIEPEVQALEHASGSSYESPEDALSSLRRMVKPTDAREARALERYVAEHLVATTDAAGHMVWRQQPEIVVPWAFLAWSTTRAEECSETGPGPQ